MGFCLFEHVDTNGIYFAVNSSGVDDMIDSGYAPDGRPMCVLDLSFSTVGFEPKLVGHIDDVEKTLLEAAKIGTRKVEVDIISGGHNFRPLSVILNQTGRIGLVREVRLSDFGSRDLTFVTASELFFMDGDRRKIVQRPGIFAAAANARGRVPILECPPGK